MHVLLRVLCAQLRTSAVHAVGRAAVSITMEADPSRTWSAKSRQAYEFYLRVGTELAQDERVKHIEGAVRDIAACRWSSKPFMYVDGSSGVGKTQLPFALARRGLFVHHQLLGVGCIGSEQAIYGCLHERSAELRSCLAADLAVVQNRVSMEELETCPLPLFTAGFFLKLLQRSAGLVVPVTLRDLRQAARQARDSGETHLIVLDEVPSLPRGAATYDMASVPLARNVPRWAELPVMLMGTNSTALNFFPASGHSRGGERSLWALLITSDKLPGLAVRPLLIMDALSGMESRGWEKLAAHFRDQLVSMRPLLAVLLRDAIECHIGDASCSTAATFLDRVRGHVARALLGSKPTLLSEAGQHGQLCMLQPACCTAAGTGVHDGPSEAESASARLAPEVAGVVNCHFAHSRSSTTSLYLDGERLTDERGVLWVPSCCFPTPEQESVLHLAMGGIEGAPTFVAYGSNTRVTVLEACCRVYRRADAAAVNWGNPNAGQLEGSFLEAVVATSMTLASRAGGVAGVDIDRFFVNLASELGPSHHPFDAARPAVSSLLECGSFLVPFLCGPGLTWPMSLATVDGVCLDSLVRLPNLERIDIRLHRTHLISAECKYHGEALGAPLLQEVLVRVPAGSVVHFVFCMRAVRMVRDKAALSAFVAQQRGGALRVRLLTVRSGGLHLSHFPGLESKPVSRRRHLLDKPGRCLVIVVPILDLQAAP